MTSLGRMENSIGHGEITAPPIYRGEIRHLAVWKIPSVMGKLPPRPFTVGKYVTWPNGKFHRSWGNYRPAHLPWGNPPSPLFKRVPLPAEAFSRIRSAVGGAIALPIGFMLKPAIKRTVLQWKKVSVFIFTFFSCFNSSLFLVFSFLSFPIHFTGRRTECPHC
jgi:hypothetical protein